MYAAKQTEGLFSTFQIEPAAKTNEPTIKLVLLLMMQTDKTTAGRVIADRLIEGTRGVGERKQQGVGVLLASPPHEHAGDGM